MALKLLTFEEALGLASKKPHLLLGNGFSISCRKDIFHYGSLYKKANFAKVPHAPELFKAAGTQDFEIVIRNLNFAAKIIPQYVPNSQTIANDMLRDASELKTILVQAIASNHPNVPNEITAEEYRSCRKFLSRFQNLYTLNYDLLLYWALMHDDVDKLRIRKKRWISRIGN